MPSCTYWHATLITGVGDSGLGCCVRVATFDRWLTSLFVDRDSSGVVQKPILVGTVSTVGCLGQTCGWLT